MAEEARKRERFYGLIEEAKPFLEVGNVAMAYKLLKESLVYAEPTFPLATEITKAVADFERDFPAIELVVMSSQ